MPRHNDVEIREDIEQNNNCPEGRVSDFAQYPLINHTKQLPSLIKDVESLWGLEDVCVSCV